MPLEPELRFRDMEQRLAEPTITVEPPPGEIDLTRIASVEESVGLGEELYVRGIGLRYRASPRNLLQNPLFSEQLQGWEASGIGRVEATQELVSPWYVVTSGARITVEPNSTFTVRQRGIARVEGRVVYLEAIVTNPDNLALTYSWSASPDIGVLLSSTESKARWIAPPPGNVDQSVTLTVIVVDSGGLSVTDSVVVIVRAL